MKRFLLGVAGLLFLGGCQMYRVQDTGTGNEYLATNWGMYQDPWRDVLELRDVRSGRDVVVREHYQMVRLNEIEALHALREPEP